MRKLTPRDTLHRLRSPVEELRVAQHTATYTWKGFAFILKHIWLTRHRPFAKNLKLRNPARVRESYLHEIGPEKGRRKGKESYHWHCLQHTGYGEKLGKTEMASTRADPIESTLAQIT